MNHSLAKEEKVTFAKEVTFSNNLGYSRPPRRDAKSSEHSIPLRRTSSLPQTVAAMHDLNAAPLFSRTQSQSTVACTQDCEHLSEDPAIANHPTFEHPILDWEHTEQALTSAFFLVWAMGAFLLGGWHAANQFSASVATLQVAISTASVGCEWRMWLSVGGECGRE